jgi:hypothetical protein
MDNILVSLPGKVSDEAMNTPPKEGFNVGKTTLAMSLFEMYCVEDTQDTKISQILDWANATTHVEFSKACKDAQAKASMADTASGFQAEENAKGADKYGPSRRVLNQRLSEAKQIFGAAKLKPTLLTEKGYWTALEASRSYLAERGLKWDNSPVLNDEVKAAKAASKLQKEALAEVMDMHEQQEGESIRDYMERMAEKVEGAIEELQAKKESDAVNKLVKSLVDKHGIDQMVLASVAIIQQHGDIDAIVAYLQD